MAQKIFLDYDEAQLDQQYDIELRDDWTHHEAEYQRLSAKVIGDFKNASYNIPYGESPNERLDIYPAKTPDAPVLLFIHGGYWREGDTAMWRFIAQGIVGHDVALVLPTYDISPDTEVRTIVEQLHKALEWTEKNITAYGGDRQNISVSGHSAGGHLAAMLMTTDWLARGYSNELIKAVVCISGLFDLQALSLCRYLRDDYSLSFNAGDIKQLSPNLLEPLVKCPLKLIVADGETAEYLRNTDLLGLAWKDKGFPVTSERYADHNHFSIMLELADPQSHLSTAIYQVAKQASGINKP